MGCFCAVFPWLGEGGDFVPMVDSFSWLRLNVPFWGLGWACLCRGWVGGCARRKDSPTDRRTQKKPPLRKGGTRREPQGGSTWLGGGSVPGDRLRPGCARESDVWRSGATDPRACHVDPACLGVAETVLPLRRGGIGSLPEQLFSLSCSLLAQGRLFLGGKIPRRPGVGPVGAVGEVRLLLRRGLPLLG